MVKSIEKRVQRIADAALMSLVVANFQILTAVTFCLAILDIFCKYFWRNTLLEFYFKVNRLVNQSVYFNSFLLIDLHL